MNRGSRRSRRLVFVSFVAVAAVAHAAVLALSVLVHSAPAIEEAPTEHLDVPTTELFAVLALEPPPEEPVVTTPSVDDLDDHLAVATTKTATPQQPSPETATSTITLGPPSVASGAPETSTTSASGDSVAPSPQGTTGKPSLDELLTLKSQKPSWAMPPVLPTGMANGPAAPVNSNEVLAAKVNKDVTGLVAQKLSGQGGPIVSAAHAAASNNLAPDVGIALFVVKTDEKGVVSSVSVASCNGYKPGWDAVAKSLGNKLTGTTFKVGPGGKGLRFEVQIQAKMALPSGAPPKGVSGGLGTMGNEGKDTTATTGTTPPPYLGVGISGTFDTSDIGQKPQRVVSVIVKSETAL